MKSSRIGDGFNIKLCSQCFEYLHNHVDVQRNKNRHQWKNTFPSFIWNLLSGKDESTDRHFNEVYSQEYLWRWVPDKLRRSWMPAMSGTYRDFLRERTQNRVVALNSCTVSSPSSFFDDRTSELEKFRDDIRSYDSKPFLRALSPEGAKSMILPDVLCPWGCTEFCHRTSGIEFCILAQHHLRRVQLNMPSASYYSRLFTVETSRDDFIRPELDQYDYVLLNSEWKIRPTTIMDSNDGLTVHVCR